jgi:hypothetical protein
MRERRGLRQRECVSEETSRPSGSPAERQRAQGIDRTDSGKTDSDGLNSQKRRKK